MSRRQALIEVMIVWGLCMALVFLIHRAREVQWFGISLNSFTAIVLILPPALVLYRRREDFDPFEKTLSKFADSLKVFVFFSASIFIPLFFLNHFFQQWFFHASWRPVFPGFSLLQTFLIQLVVAFGEEYFFRWYFLKRFYQVFKDQWSFLGVRMGWGFFLTALIFAFSHSLIQFAWWQFAIFFPSLAFGWLKEKTGHLTAPILFHALSNTFAYWVALNYQ